MATKAATAYSEVSDSFQAGVQLATNVRAALPGRVDAAVMMSTSKQDPKRLLEGVRSVLGDVPVYGGYAVGVITNDQLGYEGYQSGLAAFSFEGGARIDAFVEGGLAGNERRVGTRLGAQLAARPGDGEQGLWLLYDSVRDKSLAGDWVLNVATPLLEGMSETIGVWPPTVGVGLLGDMQFNPTYQWKGAEVVEQAAMALRFSNVRLDYEILHGCEPVGDYHRVTRAEYNVVLEIDGKPALDAVSEMLGPGAERPWEQYPLFVTLGLNRGDKYGDYREEDYANRLVAGIDRERRGLVMFEPDLVAGSEVQLMCRSVDFGYVKRRTEALLAKVADRHAFLALYIDCAGRASAYSGSDGEEAAEVQRVIGDKIPLLGAYSGVEIAKVGAEIRPLDWTGVLCVLSQPR
jgi:hypothetical protein